MSQNDDHELDGEYEEYDEDEIDIDSNQAKVIVTLTRVDDGIDGYVDTIEGVDFDPGDTGEFPSDDLLRLAGELLLAAAGYDPAEVGDFLDTATRTTVQAEEDEG